MSEPIENPTCDWCKGTGEVEAPCPANHHRHNIHGPCGRCDGTGLDAAKLRALWQSISWVARTEQIVSELQSDPQVEGMSPDKLRTIAIRRVIEEVAQHYGELETFWLGKSNVFDCDAKESHFHSFGPNKLVQVNETLYVHDPWGNLLGKAKVSETECHMSLGNCIVGATKDCMHVTATSVMMAQEQMRSELAVREFHSVRENLFIFGDGDGSEPIRESMGGGPILGGSTPPYQWRWTCANHSPGLEVKDIPAGEKCSACGRGEV